MYLAQYQNGLPRRTPLGNHGQQIEGDIRVAAQAQTRCILGVSSNQLGHQVQAAGIDVAGRVTVIAADVILLGRRAVEQTARLQKELLDVDVGGHAVVKQVGQVIQLNVIAKYPLDKRLQKQPLQSVPKWGAAQTQSGIDRQLAFGQLPDPLIQRIDEAVGLAQAQRQAKVNMHR
ncbi:hypothetical protein PS685_04291 [Pseudomonas fluorescens]|uniref:Uncharacterized protein n=1 Tax=Pseudomonas fluorescens TaxID=294 RepID=A0A5E6Z9U5_PSEFL|nr:hypothetical protein PS685_04291 [Pseudomonas fluorescens]